MTYTFNCNFGLKEKEKGKKSKQRWDHEKRKKNREIIRRENVPQNGWSQSEWSKIDAGGELKTWNEALNIRNWLKCEKTGENRDYVNRFKTPIQ